MREIPHGSAVFSITAPPLHAHSGGQIARECLTFGADRAKCLFSDSLDIRIILVCELTISIGAKVSCGALNPAGLCSYVIGVM